MNLKLESFCLRPLAVALAYLLAFNGACFSAQDQSAPKLNIAIIKGQGAVNNIRQHSAHELSVEVKDENKKPVAGATVVFLAPDSGPSAIFSGESYSITMTTDKSGCATVRTLQPNTATGQYQIHVSASYQGATGIANIRQTNATSKGLSKTTIALILAGVAGGAAVAIYLINTHHTVDRAGTISYGPSQP